MRRFRFRLQSVLRLRGQFERVARGELAAAAAAVSSIEQRLEAATRGRDDCAAEANQPGAVGALARALETGLQRHRLRLEAERQRAEVQRERARLAWLGRVREQRTVAQLREQQFAAWRLAAGRAEQAEIEALAAAGRGQPDRTGAVE
ncbi:MAG: flagellar export protein FliJ [Planctomycetes bacterium]|nr:flagellar export protein FliJ [Planctomycetota bacterium]